MYNQRNIHEINNNDNNYKITTITLATTIIRTITNNAKSNITFFLRDRSLIQEI